MRLSHLAKELLKQYWYKQNNFQENEIKLHNALNDKQMSNWKIMILSIHELMNQCHLKLPTKQSQLILWIIYLDDFQANSILYVYTHKYYLARYQN